MYLLLIYDIGPSINFPCIHPSLHPSIHSQLSRFPKPLFLSDGVLIESFEEGVTISDYIMRYSKWKEDHRDQKVYVVGGFIHLQHYINAMIRNVYRHVLQEVSTWRRRRKL